MAKLRHIAIAAKDPDAMADFYVKAFDFKIVRSNDGPLAYGHHLSDGTIDLAILRFKTDQIGRGLDYTGLHHFGILVEDVEQAAKKRRGVWAASITWTRPRPSASAGSRSSSTAPKVSSSTSPSIPGPAPSRFRSRRWKPRTEPRAARITRSPRRRVWPHHIVIFVVQDMAMPHISGTGGGVERV